MKKLLVILPLFPSLLGGAEPVTLEWLAKGPPAVAQTVSWGVPWPRGVVPRATSFQLTDGKGLAMPVQSWPMAYWPDGSLKWTGHAAVAEKAAAGPFKLSVGPAVEPAVPLQATQSADAIEIRMRSAIYRIPRRGSSLVGSVSVEGREIATEGKLIAIRGRSFSLRRKNSPRRGFYRLCGVRGSGEVRAGCRRCKNLRPSQSRFRRAPVAAIYRSPLFLGGFE